MTKQEKTGVECARLIVKDRLDRFEALKGLEEKGNGGKDSAYLAGCVNACKELLKDFDNLLK